MRIKLSKFNPDEMKQHRTILLIGKRGTGKSVLLEDLLYHLRNKLDFGLAFSPTRDSLDMFEKHMPSSWLHDQFNGAKIDQLCSMQRNSPKEKKRNLLLVLDDMMADKRVLKSVGIRDIFFNGRHEYITYISSQQYCLDMPPDLRSNIDYVFCLKDNILANKQRLWKYFFGMFNKIEDFCTVMDAVTANYGVMCLDNTVGSNEICDQLSWYRAAPDLPDFKIGKPIFWKMHHATVKSNEKIANEKMDRQQAMRMHEEKSKSRTDRILSVHKADENGNLVDEPVQML